MQPPNRQVPSVSKALKLNIPRPFKELCTESLTGEIIYHAEWKKTHNYMGEKNNARGMISTC